jgi:hypothetical protein
MFGINKHKRLSSIACVTCLPMYRGFSSCHSFWWKQNTYSFQEENMWIPSNVDWTFWKTHDSSRLVWFSLSIDSSSCYWVPRLTTNHNLIFIPDVNKTLWQRLMRMQPITSHFHSYLCCVSPYCRIKFDSTVIRILKLIHISAWYHPTNLLFLYTRMFYPGELLYTHCLTQPLRNYSWLYLGEYSRRVTTDSQRSQMVRLFLSAVSFSLV